MMKRQKKKALKSGCEAVRERGDSKKEIEEWQGRRGGRIHGDEGEKGGKNLRGWKAVRVEGRGVGPNDLKIKKGCRP